MSSRFLTCRRDSSDDFAASSSHTVKTEFLRLSVIDGDTRACDSSVAGCRRSGGR